MGLFDQGAHLRRLFAEAAGKLLDHAGLIGVGKKHADASMGLGGQPAQSGLVQPPPGVPVGEEDVQLADGGEVPLPVGLVDLGPRPKQPRGLHIGGDSGGLQDLPGERALADQVPQQRQPDRHDQRGAKLGPEGRPHAPAGSTGRCGRTGTTGRHPERPPGRRPG